MNTRDRIEETEDRADALISHIVDGDASPEQWQELETLALAQPRLWRDLGQAQRDASMLRASMSLAGDIAERVPLPPSGPSDFAPNESDLGSLAHPTLRINRFGAWTGWLVAAVITLVASVQMAQQHTQSPPGAPAQMTGAGAGLVQSAADAWNTYLQRGVAEGSVVGEVPGKVVVESRPVQAGQDGIGGGYEVIFVRQVVERAIVPDLYQVNGEDERGQPTLTRYRQAVLRRPL